jgi:multiple antibiotic resistance protein
MILDFLRACTLAFVPMFFAVDAISILPLYVGLTDGMEMPERRRVLWESVGTALAVSLGFLLLGRSVFKLMGVTVNDFMIAGGVLLFLLATLDMVSAQKPARQGLAGVGAVPIGTPLIAGPAVLAMSLILVDLYGWAATIIAVSANVLLAGGVLSSAEMIGRVLGKTGVRVASKVSSLLLAAFAVMMVRQGLVAIIRWGTAK